MHWRPYRSLFHSNPAWIVAALGVMVLTLCVIVPPALAGPPFRTDDPETVEYRHGEFYIANQYSHDKDSVFATAPHLELNYGVIPNVQLHMIAPLAYSMPHEGPTTYGLSDLELGVKYRFIQEGRYMPMVGTFPILHLPTGNAMRGLGSGETQLLLPIWLQKAWGPWQSYGGGGYWINPGQDNRNYWYLGWQGQREITKWLTFGGELFYTTAQTRDGTYELGYNAGGIIDFTENHHLLFSAGADMHGSNLFSYYLAYQYTWGPSEGKARFGKR